MCANIKDTYVQFPITIVISTGIVIGHIVTDGEFYSTIIPVVLLATSARTQLVR